MPENNVSRPHPVLPWATAVSASTLPATRLVPTDPDVYADRVRVRYPWGWKPRAQSVIDESWRQQVLLVNDNGVRLRIQSCLEVDAYAGVAGDQYAAGIRASWPLKGEVLVVGSVRGPEPTLRSEAVARRDSLREVLELYGVETSAADLVDRHHNWTEPALIATGANGCAAGADWQERVANRCRQRGMTTLVLIRDGRWEVVGLDTRGPRSAGVMSSDRCSITRDDDHRCILKARPARGEYCQMAGGPYGSAAIHSALAWKDFRDSLHQAIACETCDGTRYGLQDKVYEGGGPIGLVTTPNPTRWLEADNERWLTWIDEPDPE